MKRFLYILITLLVFICIGTFTAYADTNITKLDTNSGSYYVELEQPLDWLVVKQSTGALVWINDLTKFSFEEVKQLAMDANPSLVHSVDYWGLIGSYGIFSNVDGNITLPNGFQGNMWGSYTFMRTYINLNGVSNITYAYTDETIVTPPNPPEPPTPPVVPEPPEKPVVPVTPVTPDYSPKTGDVDSQTMVLLAIMLMGAVAMWFVTYRR